VDHIRPQAKPTRLLSGLLPRRPLNFPTLFRRPGRPGMVTPDPSQAVEARPRASTSKQRKLKFGRSSNICESRLFNKKGWLSGNLFSQSEAPISICSLCMFPYRAHPRHTCPGRGVRPFTHTHPSHLPRPGRTPIHT
jgi:hypothetical protein